MKTNQIMRTIHTFLLVAIAWLCIPGSSPAQESVIRNTDSIMLKVVGIPNEEAVALTGLYPISQEGTLGGLLYLKEPIRAAGLSPTALARKIEQAYVNAQIYKMPKVTVTPSRVGDGGTGRMVSVTGEVRQGRQVIFTEGMRLMDAIAACGGPSDFADMRKVRVIRDQVASFYNLRDLSKDTRPNIPLMPGDTVIVPK